MLNTKHVSVSFFTIPQLAICTHRSRLIQVTLKASKDPMSCLTCRKPKTQEVFQKHLMVGSLPSQTNSQQVELLKSAIIFNCLVKMFIQQNKCWVVFIGNFGTLSSSSLEFSKCISCLLFKLKVSWIYLLYFPSLGIRPCTLYLSGNLLRGNRTWLLLSFVQCCLLDNQWVNNQFFVPTHY